MIKNDFRYIIKKIIIGLGIFIGIFYFKSCNVSALANLDYHYETDITFNVYKPGGNESYHLNVDYNKLVDLSNYNYYLVLLQVNRTGDDYIKFLKSNQPFNMTGEDLSYYWVNIKNSNTFTEETCNLTTNTCSVSSRTGFLAVYTQSFYDLTHSRNVSSNWIILDGNYNIVDSNKTIDYYISGNYNEYVPPPLYSNIVSLNPQPIVNDNILLGFNFELEFDNFDTSYFIYKYKFNNGNTISFATNNYILNFFQNGTLIVWSEDLEGNVIDSESFTISDIGEISDSNNIYDILFSSHGKGVSDNQMYGVYTNVDINVVYKPNTDYLIYQYQYVNENSSLDNNNWVTHDSNILDINVTQNGTLYTRILDNNDNLLYSATFTNSIIGDEIVYNVDDDQMNSFYSGIKSNIGYNKPVSSLLLLPVTLFSNILNGMNATCVDYNLGNLMGTNLSLPCINVRSYLGDSLYLTIDLIVSGVLIFRIICFIIKCYNGLIFMKKNPVDDFTGDRE